MTSYINDIIDLLQGDTPRQKYEYLKKLLNKNTCIGCRYNSEETNVWHPNKCTKCIREDRLDMFEPIINK